MVKLFYLAVFHKQGVSEAQCLKVALDLTSFGYFQRNSVSEFMNFTAKVIIDRSVVPSRISVNEKEYLCHVYLRADGLIGVVISDQDYPHRVAHTLLTKILDEFTAANAVNNPSAFTSLDMYLAKFQNPKEADAMTKLQADLDETKIILHNTITALFQRGEKLDDLVAKSNELSAQSKVFYKTARKTNQCCQYL